MTTDPAASRERLERLRRTAYGRTTSPDDEQRAAAARLELEELGGMSAAAPADEPVAAEAHPPPAVDELEELHAITRTRGWVLPAIVALVVGVFIGGSAIALLRPTSAAGDGVSPGSRPKSEVAVVPVVVPGDLDAAERLFAAEQSDDDKTTSELVKEMNIVETTTRLVQWTETEKVWVGKNDDDSLCIVVIDFVEGAGGGSCTSPDAFVQSGVQIGLGFGLSVAWDGARVITTTATTRQPD